MTVVDVGRALVGDRFPGAVGAVLAGSAITAHRTATSDLDVVVFLDGRPAPYRRRPSARVLRFVARGGADRDGRHRRLR